MEFEVRHWMTNNEATINKFGKSSLPPAGLQTDAKVAPSKKDLGPATGKPNTIGNIFYGSKGYLAIQRTGNGLEGTIEFFPEEHDTTNIVPG